MILHALFLTALVAASLGAAGLLLSALYLFLAADNPDARALAIIPAATGGVFFVIDLGLWAIWEMVVK